MPDPAGGLPERIRAAGLEREGNKECRQPLGICVQSNLGRMVLPSTKCDCASAFGASRVSMPPILWLVMGLGILLYSWLANWNFVREALAQDWASLYEFFLDFSNMILPLTVLGIIFLMGGVREMSLRRKAELSAPEAG